MTLRLLMIFWLPQTMAAVQNPIATVNGHPISAPHVQALKHPDESPEEALNRAILYRLAVEKAKAEGLETSPEVREEIEKVLYKAFLEKRLKSAKRDFLPSENQLRREYQQAPMVRVRHLFLPARSEKEKSAAMKDAAQIRAQCTKGASFEKLVLKHSQDPSVRWGGDSDFRGKNAMPSAFYERALELKQGEVSAPFLTEDGVHLIQLIGHKPFEDAPATYRTWLKKRWSLQQERLFLQTELEELRKHAKIQLFPAQGERQ